MALREQPLYGLVVHSLGLQPRRSQPGSRSGVYRRPPVIWCLGPAPPPADPGIIGGGVTHRHVRSNNETSSGVGNALLIPMALYTAGLAHGRPDRAYSRSIVVMPG